MATIITPYTTLVAQLAGVVIAGLALARVMRSHGPARALATAGVGLLAVLLLPTLWSAAAVNEGIRATLVTGPGVRARELCFTANGRGDQIAFARWLEARIPPHDAVGFVPGTVSGPCLQLDLLPRRFVPQSAHPRWVIITRLRTPARSGHIEVFRPGMALERRG